MPPNHVFFVPNFQTLMLLSSEPDTIVLPSGEKATELISPLCALLFSLFSSSVAAWEGGASKFSQGGAVFGGYVPESQTL